MSGWGRTGNHIPPARQRKIEAIRAAVEKRGYAFRDLAPCGGGGWDVAIRETPEAIDAPIYHSRVSSASFDGLLQNFADDLVFARWVHWALGETLRREVNTAVGRASAAAKNYGYRTGEALAAMYEGRAAEHVRLTREAGQYHAEAERLYNALPATKEALDTYNATAPPTPEEAAIYLAGLPRVKDRPARADEE